MATQETLVQKYLTTYFAERNLPNRTIQYIDDQSMCHYIDSDEVIRMVIEVASYPEQAQIRHTIREIEWHNPEAIHGFIDHLASCYIKTNF